IKGILPFKMNPGKSTLLFKIEDPGLSDHLWSEFNPELLTLKVEGKKFGVVKSEDFGMREISSDGKAIKLNGKDIFLRGTLECCIYPLTGYPPMDEAGWEKVFETAKEWGLNHLRFHSWCPPDVAFKVADKMGFYLQVECPLWVTGVNAGNEGSDGEMKRFIREEFDRIVDNYGNHPSFCLMTMGNELQHDFTWLNDLVEHARKKDPRHLYACSSFTFEKGHGGHAEPQDQFLVTQWTDDGWVRGQGVFDVEAPSFNKDYARQTEALTVPLIEHEIGQYAVYPDLSEIDFYTGVLDPKNFKAIRADLEAKGRLHRANDYLMASGKLASVLYKEEIERALKTDGVSGIQLLGLQDFPGQGTALVGLVNAFWESKGIVDPEYFSQFCAPVVPLARFEKAVYTADEDFEAEIEIANYSSDSLTLSPEWKLTDGEILIASGQLPEKEFAIGRTGAGAIKVPLMTVEKAKKLKFEISGGEGIGNSWSVWVYPESPDIASPQVLVTNDFNEAEKALKEGGKVLLSPSKENITGMESHFVPVFWSPVHFPKQAGGMGIWCDPAHPALSEFPTDAHTDWQWWSPLKNAVNVNLEEIGGVTPIVEVVDNFTTNRNLGLIFEAKVGNGKLLFSAIDLVNAEDPASRQLLHSLLRYMESDSFSPVHAIDFGNLPKKLN
ncbi:MAG: glycoside hydrolase family 2, partial [Muribaculaceae bacterium]|nr:glycoside hydrolase family 2 [Muribaculaceae bacterium]